jgi:hypothetical protein
LTHCVFFDIDVLFEFLLLPLLLVHQCDNEGVGTCRSSGSDDDERGRWAVLLSTMAPLVGWEYVPSMYARTLCGWKLQRNMHSFI